jgi:3-(3-hydroxy-phenyl)propionate hydroxylase
VIGWDSPALRAHARRLLPPGMPGRVVALLRHEDDFVGPRTGAAGTAGALPGDTAIEGVRDATGELGRLLDAWGAVAVVVRPDRYWFRLVDAASLARLASEAPTPPGWLRPADAA